MSLSQLASGQRLGALLVTAAMAAWSAPATAAPPVSDLAPVPRGANRLQAVAALSGGGALPVSCLTPILQSARQNASAALPVRRAVAALSIEAPMSGERRVGDRDGNVVRFTLDRGALDRLDPGDDDGNGRPDAVDAALEALASAQHLMGLELELPPAGPVDVVLARLGSGIDGFITISRGGRAQLWVESAPRGGLPALRRAVEHQYAHAVGAAAGLDPSWGESLATWTTLALEGEPDDRTATVLARRLGTMGEGLVTDDLELSAGNAAWFAFLEQAYGTTAVKLVVEELGRGGPAGAALDSALRRAAGDTLDAALRDFQLWSLLVGPRDDGRHFTFASRMPGPSFAATADALPALSIQTDPELAPLGTAAVLLRPNERSGGVALRFEGDLTARWGADVLLVRNDGSMQRVPVALDADGAGEVTVPVQELREAVLLVRDLDGDGRAPRRYSWAATYQPGYPVEIASVRVDPAGPAGGALVSWDALRETGVIGYNVLRASAEGGPVTRVNPVWIPAVGDAATSAGYTFLDSGAAAGIVYRYRIEAVTSAGLSSRTDPVVSSTGN